MHYSNIGMHEYSNQSWYIFVCPTSLKLYRLSVAIRTGRDASQQYTKCTISSLLLTHLLLARHCIQQSHHHIGNSLRLHVPDKCNEDIPI